VAAFAPIDRFAFDGCGQGSPLRRQCVLRACIGCRAFPARGRAILSDAFSRGAVAARHDLQAKEHTLK
jgi:hypothetical protein